MSGALNSLSTPSTEQFITEVVEALRARGAVEVEVDHEDFAVRSADTTFYLASAYARYCRCWPWQRRRLIARFVALADGPGGGGDATWSEAAGQIVPAVRDRFSVQTIHYLDEANGRPARVIPSRELTERLCLTLALDRGDRFVLVTGAMLDSWQVSFQQAQDVAMVNLERESVDGIRPVVHDRIFEGRWGDGNCASRLLLDEPIRGLPIRGLPVFVVPDRASFLVTGSDDDDGLAALLRFLDSTEQVEQPVSRIPVVRRWPNFESMDLPAGHPLYPALRRQVLRDWSEIYRDQHELLNRVLQRREDHAIVAPHLVYQPDDPDQAPQSFTTWSPGAPTLLPQVDQIAFVDPDRGEDGEVLGMVDWQTVAGILPIEEDRTDDYPMRYRVAGFPDPTVLRSLLEGAEQRSPTGSGARVGVSS